MHPREIINLSFVCQVSELVEIFNSRIYSDTINVITVKLCMMELLIKLYLVLPLSVTLAICQGHSNIAQFEQKVLCSCPVQLKLCRVVK